MKTKNINKSFAFTLAEVLITLSIIGVVSAMTLPNLIAKYQKKVVEKRVTQDFSMIQQAIKMQEAHGLDITSESVPDNDTKALYSWYDKYWAPYLITAKVCFDAAGCWQDKGRNKSLANESVLYDRGSIGIGYNIITVRLQNGTSILFDAYYSGSLWGYFGVKSDYTGVVIFVDANGDSLPNVVGKDIYIFVNTQELGLVPAGYGRTHAQIRANCNKNATGPFAGYYCLSRVKLDGWKILDEVWDE